MIDFCDKGVPQCGAGLDGRKEVNDRFRKDYAGHGSYDTIVPKFQEFVKKRGDKNYYMRGTSPTTMPTSPTISSTCDARSLLS